MDFRIHHIFPLAMDRLEWFKTRPPQWKHYYIIDFKRCAKFRKLPISWPQPDPVQQNRQNWDTAPDQELMTRLSCLGEIAEQEGRGLEFSFEVFNLLWDGQTTGWDEGEHLSLAAKRAGLDLEHMNQRLAENPEFFTATVQQNTKDRNRYHWGGPVFVYRDEPFHGQDRWEYLLAAIDELAQQELLDSPD